MFHKRSQRTQPTSKTEEYLEDLLGIKEDITRVTDNKDTANKEDTVNRGTANREATASRDMASRDMASRDTANRDMVNLDMDNKEDTISSNNRCMSNSSVTPEEEQRAVYWRA